MNIHEILSLGDFTFNDPATEIDIRNAEHNLSRQLPKEYKEFMLQRSGGEGFVGQQYLILWQVSELAALNRDYEVARYAPGIILFGSNGGGEAFAFDGRSENMSIVMVPFIGLSLTDAKPLAENFVDFILKISNGVRI